VIIEELSKKKGEASIFLLIVTQAGWDWSIMGRLCAGFKGVQQRNEIHVWVDETRPRNQGASLTAWELINQGVPHTVIADNTGGHLMQRGLVDIVITGADRVTRTGDVANKIGTYLKALAARDNNIPFYVALPSSSFDLNIADGIKEIRIEERDPDEVRYISGLCEGELKKVLLTPPEVRH
jgi:methylthioribose-1-phosphate isomerase